MNRALIELAAVVAALAVSIPGAFGRTLELGTDGNAGHHVDDHDRRTFPLKRAGVALRNDPGGMGLLQVVNTRKGPDGDRHPGTQDRVEVLDDGYNPARPCSSRTS